MPGLCIITPAVSMQRHAMYMLHCTKVKPQHNDTPVHDVVLAAYTPCSCTQAEQHGCMMQHAEDADTEQQSVVMSLAKALQVVLSQRRAGLQMPSSGDRVSSAALKAVCVLLLPSHFTHGSGTAMQLIVSCPHCNIMMISSLLCSHSLLLFAACAGQNLQS